MNISEAPRTLNGESYQESKRLLLQKVKNPTREISGDTPQHDKMLFAAVGGIASLLTALYIVRVLAGSPQLTQSTSTPTREIAVTYSCGPTYVPGSSDIFTSYIIVEDKGIDPDMEGTMTVLRDTESRHSATVTITPPGTPYPEKQVFEGLVQPARNTQLPKNDEQEIKIQSHHQYSVTVRSKTANHPQIDEKTVIPDCASYKPKES